MTGNVRACPLHAGRVLGKSGSGAMAGYVSLKTGLQQLRWDNLAGFGRTCRTAKGLIRDHSRLCYLGDERGLGWLLL